MPDETFDLKGFISQQWAGGEDAATAVAPETPAAPASETPSDTPEGAGEAQQTPEGEESPFRWENVPAELEPLAKQFQADYTRKMQEVAEQRRAFEAQQQQVAGLMALQQMAQEDPARAAQVAQQWAAQLAASLETQQQTADPYAGLDPASPVEELLIQQNRDLQQRMDQFARWQEQQAQGLRERAGWEKLNAGYAQIEAQAGRQLTEQERDQIAAFCIDNGIQNVSHGYKLMTYDAELARVAQKARDEASTVVQAKQGLPGTPSTLQSRASSSSQPPGVAGSRERIEWAVKEAMAAAEG